MSWTILSLFAIVGLVIAAVVTGRSDKRSDLAFPLIIIAGMVAALAYPGPFLRWGDYPLTSAIVPMIQIIMFGMGMTLSPADFLRVLKIPQAALVGIVLQFAVMPFVGFSLATAFGFTGATAAGVVLVGSVPGGVASNVITFLARGDVALSVTMTSVKVWHEASSYRLMLLSMVSGLVMKPVLMSAGFMFSW